MSVLNDMLRDLHQREAVPAEVPDSLLAGMTDETHGEDRRHRMRRLGMVVVAVASVLAGYAVSPYLGRELALYSAKDTGSAVVPARTGQIKAVPPTAGRSILAGGVPGSALSLRLVAALPVEHKGETSPHNSQPVPRSVEAPPAGPAQATAVRVHQTPAGAIGRIALDRPADFRVFTLSRPDRVVTDIFGAEGQVDRGSVVGSGVVDGVRIMADAREALRVVLDLNAPVQLRESRIIDGKPGEYLLEVELSPAPVSVPPVASRPALAPAPPEGAGMPLEPFRSAGNRPVVASEPDSTAGTMEKTPVVLSPQDRAESHYRHALRLARSGRAAAAQTSLRAALAADGSHRQARELLAVRYLDGRRFAQAEALIVEGLARWPEDPDLTRLQARLWLEKGDPASALGLLDVNMMPPLAADPEYHAFRAVLLQKTGRDAEAARVYEGLVQLRPQAGVWWMGLAISLEASGKPHEALKAYRKAVGKPDMTSALMRFVKSRAQALAAPTS